MTALVFILFAGCAIGCAASVIYQRNPLYSAISLIGVFISLAALYVTLAAPFIAAVQVIVYAGAIMVLVVFVIMLLNVEEEERRFYRLKHLVPLVSGLAIVLVAEVFFVIRWVGIAPPSQNPNVGIAADTGLTVNVGQGLYTYYLLPFEFTSLLLLMAIVGSMSLARRSGVMSETMRVVPGTQVLAQDVLNSTTPMGDLSAVEAKTTGQAARLMGVDNTRISK